MAVYKTEIVSISEVARDTFEVSLRRPKSFDFEAGQYIQVRIPWLKNCPDCKGSSRVMSILSSPNEKDVISIAFRNTGSDFKNALTLKDSIGKEILIEGPYGFFTLPKEKKERIVFIAGGIGITPFLSMVRFLDEKGFDFPVNLMYFNRDKKSSAYLFELEKISSRYKNFTLNASFQKISEDMIKKCVKDINGVKWYVVGPPGMMDAVFALLLKVGVDEDNIFKEGFVGY